MWGWPGSFFLTEGKLNSSLCEARREVTRTGKQQKYDDRKKMIIMIIIIW